LPAGDKRGSRKREREWGVVEFVAADPGKRMWEGETVGFLIREAGEIIRYNSNDTADNWMIKPWYCQSRRGEGPGRQTNIHEFRFERMITMTK